MAVLSDIDQAFVLHWGEMGTRWGINRTVAQIHALLYLSPEPLNADQIIEALGVARSNVSNSLRELQGWRLVKVVHVLGDRRDHYESLKDVWEMFQVILDERKKRETDPTLQVLTELVGKTRKTRACNAYTAERLKDMLEFFEAMSVWYTQVRKLPTRSLVRFIKMGDRLGKIIGLKR